MYTNRYGNRYYSIKRGPALFPSYQYDGPSYNQISRLGLAKAVSLTLHRIAIIEAIFAAGGSIVVGLTTAGVGIVPFLATWGAVAGGTGIIAEVASRLLDEYAKLTDIKHLLADVDIEAVQKIIEKGELSLKILKKYKTINEIPPLELGVVTRYFADTWKAKSDLKKALKLAQANLKD